MPIILPLGKQELKATLGYMKRCLRKREEREREGEGRQEERRRRGEGRRRKCPGKFLVVNFPADLAREQAGNKGTEMRITVVV